MLIIAWGRHIDFYAFYFELLNCSAHQSHLPVQDELLRASEELPASLMLFVSFSLTVLLSPTSFPLHFLKQLCKQGCSYLYVTEILLTPEITVAIKRKLKSS